MSAQDPTDSPLHGFRGDLTPPPSAVGPRGVCVAVSREAGSRGGEAAAAAGKLLGWTVYTQEMLEFLTQDEQGRGELAGDLPDTARRWVEVEFAALVRNRKLDPAAELGTTARLVLSLAARGDVILVGRGAGFLLPAASTIHARVVAPLPQRVAFTAQAQRLTDAEAEQAVRARDRRRTEFLASVAGRDPTDPSGYDFVLNSARLGVDGCAAAIAHAVREKLGAAGHVAPSWGVA